MARKYTHRLPMLLSIAGEEHEVEVDVQYTVTPGRPATPPSYESGGDPPTDAEIEILSVTVVGEPSQAPSWLWLQVRDSDAVYQALGDAADWGVPYRDPDYARDERIDADLRGTR